MIIIDACVRSKLDVTVCSAEKSKLMDTAFRDFVKIVNDWNVPIKAIHEREGVVHFKSGSYLEFIGLDKQDVGKGRRRDIIFMNEANRCTLSAYADVSQRAKVMVCDYNPDALFWLNNLQNEKNFINLTYKDNEFLPEAEVRNIERYYTLGYNADGTIRSDFWANKWRVYGLGEVGSVEGRIYNWKKISNDEYNRITSMPIYCADWGIQHPMAVIEMKHYDGDIYIHELNYASENEIRGHLNSTQLRQINSKPDDGLITWLFERWQIPKNAVIVCDCNRPSKILTLRNAGWEFCYGITHKSKLLDRISMVSNLNVHYTESSKNAEYEQQNYRFALDKFGNTMENPLDLDNHICDCVSYGIQHYFSQGIIRII